MKQTDPIGGKRLVSQVIGHLGGRSQIDLGRLLDQGIHHVRLFPFCDLFPQEPVDLVPFLFGENPGGDDSPPGGKLVDDGNIQIAIQSHGQGSRNRGGGHDQDVGVVSLLFQIRSLTSSASF